MTNTFNYSTRLSHVPKWTLMDRLTKSRNDFGMSMKEFSAFTDLSMRQIQYAEGGKGKVSDVIVTVYSAKTGVDYWWLKTGLDPNEDPSGAGFGEELPGLDSNQEPIGSQLSNGISLYRGVPKPPWFLEPHPPDTKETVRKSQSAQSDNKTEFPKVGPETSNVYYLNLDSSKRAA
jgi:hypothetical protein